MRKWETECAEFRSDKEFNLQEAGWEPFSVTVEHYKNEYDSISFDTYVFYRRLVEDQQNLIDPSPIFRGEDDVPDLR